MNTALAGEEQCKWGDDREKEKKNKRQRNSLYQKPETELHVESCETIIRENEEEAQGIKQKGSKKECWNVNRNMKKGGIKMGKREREGR